MYKIRQVFRVPLPFAFGWCTDFSTEDGRLAGDGHQRRLLSRRGRTIIYETLYEEPQGWSWSRQTVRLHPPDRWTARAEGNYRTWDLVYTLRALDDDSTEFRFWGRRRPVGLGAKNPSQKAMKDELTKMWQNFGKAMEREYHSVARGRKRWVKPAPRARPLAR